MHGELQEITLENVAGGIVPEMFERHLEDVLRDIDDPNTDPKAKRTITIEVTFSPSEDRRAAAVWVKFGAKKAGVKPMGTVVHLGRKGGRLVAMGADPNQGELDFEASLAALDGGKR